MRVIGIVICFCFCLTKSYAQKPVLISDTVKQHIFAFNEIEFFEDPTGKLTIHDVQLPEVGNRFRPSVSFNPENVNRKSAYWHRIKIKHRLTEKEWVIEFFDQTIDRVDFFAPEDDGTYKQVTYGDLFSFSNRPLEHKNFVIPIDNDIPGERIYYFRIESQQQAEAIVVLRSSNYLFEYAIDEYFLFGIFYGMILVFSFYNLLMYAAVRESHYLFYILYLAGIGLYEMSVDGIGFQYLWPDSIIWNQYAPGLTLYLASTASLLFAVSVLNIRTEVRWLWKLICGAFIFRTLFLLLSIFVFQSWFSFRVIELIPFSVTFYAAIYRWRNGYSAARFLVIGYFFLLFGAISKVSLYFDFSWMPFGQLSHYSLSFCFIMEMIFLSFAISDKIRMFRVEKAEAQDRTIEQLEINQQLKDNQNRELEEQVKIKTRELVIANEQLLRQADEIAAMNALLTKDNIQLQHDVAEVKEARVLSKEVDFEEFSAMYPDDESCLRFLADAKWQNGYVCQHCNHTGYSAGKAAYSRRCSRCGYDESVTAHTILQGTRLPINKAFYMIFLVYSSRGRISSHKLSEILQIRQSTCWAYSSKIKKAIKEKQKHGHLHTAEGWKSILIDEKAPEMHT